MKRLLAFVPSFLTLACAPAAPPSPPCFTIQGGTELREKDANKTLDELTSHIRLAPEDEALREPKSLEDVRAILRRDAVYLFPAAAAFARSLNSLEGRFAEAYLELLLGESQLIASQVLSVQAAWVSGDLRVARASLAIERGQPTDRGRLLAQLIRVVEEGNKIADALGAVAPSHLARGAEVVRGLRAEAPADPETQILVAELHRLRGEWTEFDAAMKAAEASPSRSPALRYLRGMEQVERYQRRQQGAAIMRESLAAFPKLVRAQVILVLLANNPRVALREIGKLRQMNEDHYLVMLLEPVLAADHELARLQKREMQDAPSATAGDGAP
ncbi:MAG: hypothetical protein KF819_35410 [Labilithrix sp.]|nr:hypothetical protein [Labilithrix sp.]